MLRPEPWPWALAPARDVSGVSQQSDVPACQRSDRLDVGLVLRGNTHLLCMRKLKEFAFNV